MPRLPKNFIDRKKFLAILPSKRVSVGTVLLNQSNHILMVKPIYKDHWTYPGGVVDKDESPYDACIRETLEEVGLKVKPKNLLVTIYANNPKLEDESVHLLFFVGKITKKQINSIKIPANEIAEYKFVNLDEVEKYNSKFAKYAKKFKRKITAGKNFGYLEETI